MRKAFDANIPRLKPRLRGTETVPAASAQPEPATAPQAEPLVPLAIEPTASSSQKLAPLEDRELCADREGPILVKPMARIRHRSLVVRIEERRRLQMPMCRLLQLMLVPIFAFPNPVNAHGSSPSSMHEICTLFPPVPSESAAVCASARGD